MLLVITFSFSLLLLFGLTVFVTSAVRLLVLGVIFLLVFFLLVKPVAQHLGAQAHFLEGIALVDSLDPLHLVSSELNNSTIAELEVQVQAVDKGHLVDILVSDLEEVLVVQLAVTFGEVTLQTGELSLDILQYERLR